jgi:DNA-binding response OmpR family regulator
MKSILVLDDDQLSVEFIKLFLEGEGFSVFSAFSCSQARAQFEEHLPEVVVVDLELEDGSGIDFAKFAKESNNARVILASGHGQEHLKNIGADLSVLDVILTKPIELSDLKEAVAAS